MGAYAVALDPGGTTGIALVRDECNPWEIEVEQLGPHPHHQPLLSRLAQWRPRYIICESFDNRGQDAAILASVEYIGVVKLFVAISGETELVSRSASLGKQFWTDIKLKRYNVYCNGKHARDAVRHYLYYRSFTLHDVSLIADRARGTVTPYQE